MEIQTPEFIDNINKTLSISLKEEIKPGSKLSIAAACFSIYAYQELREQLKDIDEFRFIFTSPTFVTDKLKKEKREFYIPRLNRERNLYGTEFEVKLRNELNQKAIAKECAEWIRRKAIFKSNLTQKSMPSFINIDETNYNPVKEFTAVELGVEKGNNAAFADTAQYLFDNVSKIVKNKYKLDSAMVSGTSEGKCTLEKFKNDLNAVLTYFSPNSKDKDVIYPDDTRSIDLLIATDCISEGQNLQDCDYLINYDIHWNPVRIIQRFGRIDRIGSKNSVIQLVNFWPDMTLDDYINLKSRVETRMKIVDMTATADDNLLESEQNDLDYRKTQLQKLKEEVVDIEEMSSGISIMDLGLNEFRLDLLEYVKEHGELDNAPFGLHAVTKSTEDCPPGVIYVLKNRNNSVNIDNQNRLHPFYMIYIGEDGQIVCNHLSPKELLDKVRLLCKGKTEPIPEAYILFNKDTRDGKNMKEYSSLLGEAITSIISVKEENDTDVFLSGGKVSFAKTTKIKGLEDFELICFLVVEKVLEGKH